MLRTSQLKEPFKSKTWLIPIIGFVLLLFCWIILPVMLVVRNWKVIIDDVKDYFEETFLSLSVMWSGVKDDDGKV